MVFLTNKENMMNITKEQILSTIENNKGDLSFYEEEGYLEVRVGGGAVVWAIWPEDGPCDEVVLHYHPRDKTPWRTPYLWERDWELEGCLRSEFKGAFVVANAPTYH